MWTLRLQALVRPEKRREFLDSLRTLPGTASSPPEGHQILFAVDDETSICWLADWQSREEVVAFINSDVCHALRGAVRILGSLRSWQVFELRRLPEIDEPDLPTSQG